MKSIFQNEALFLYLKNLINPSKLKISKYSMLLFVCGAKLNAYEGKSARKRFIDYADRNLKEFDFFIAEKFFNSFTENTDLMTIEDQLAGYSDCIIVFLESESAIAELGAFSNSKELSKQLLVINNKKYLKSDSFIINGPLRKINNSSDFGNVIYCDLCRVLESVQIIVERLEKQRAKVNKTLNIDSFSDYKQLNSKNKMLLLLDLITLFQPIRELELIEILKKIIGDGYYKINFDLTLLLALGYIAFNGEFYYKVKDKTKLYYIYATSTTVRKIRAKIISIYHKQDSKRITLYIENITSVEK